MPEIPSPIAGSLYFSLVGALTHFLFTQVGDGILSTILVAIQGILRDKMQEDYLRLLKVQQLADGGSVIFRR
jgi:hypothetical protein